MFSMILVLVGACLAVDVAAQSCKPCGTSGKCCFPDETCETSIDGGTCYKTRDRITCREGSIIVPGFYCYEPMSCCGNSGCCEEGSKCCTGVGRDLYMSVDYPTCCTADAVCCGDKCCESGATCNDFGECVNNAGVKWWYFLFVLVPIAIVLIALKIRSAAVRNARHSLMFHEIPPSQTTPPNPNGPIQPASFEVPPPNPNGPIQPVTFEAPPPAYEEVTLATATAVTNPVAPTDK